VVATGETHSVQEFIERSFSAAGLDWHKYVSADNRFRRPIDVDCLRGDYGKAKRKLGWEPEVKFAALVDIMVNEDIDRWKKWQKGEFFHWDALNYDSEHNIILSRDNYKGKKFQR